MLIRRFPRRIVPFVLTVALFVAGSSPLVAQRGEAETGPAVHGSLEALIGKVVAWLGSELGVLTDKSCAVMDPDGCPESRSEPDPAFEPTEQPRPPAGRSLPRPR